MELFKDIYSSDASSDPPRLSRNERNLPFNLLGVSDVTKMRNDLSQRYIVPPGMEKVRIPIWNLRDGWRQQGNSNPHLENLNGYHKRNDHCDVFTGQTRETHPQICKKEDERRISLGVSDAKKLRKDYFGWYIVPPTLAKVRIPIWNLRDARRHTGRTCNASEAQLLPHEKPTL